MAILTKDPPVAFVHIMKAAGTSITVWLRNQGGVRITGKHLELRLQDIPKDVDVDNLFSFTCVRNPWESAVSLFIYTQEKVLERGTRRGLSEDDDYMRILKYSFSDWVVIKPDWNYNKDQYWKSSILNYTMRFENLNEDFKLIQEKFDCFEPLGVINKSDYTKRKRNYRDYYTDEAYDIITKNCATDIEKLNYKF